MVLAGAGQVVVETAAVVFLAGTVAAVTGAWLAVRAARRRLQRWRHLRGVVAVVASSPMADPRWWGAQQQRHQLWRAVSGAERAVRAARSAGAPTGDLAGLIHQLRVAARAVDAALRAGAAGPSARSEARDVVASAAEIQQLATDAVMSIARPETAGIAQAVRVEVAALRHGLAAATHR